MGHAFGDASGSVFAPEDLPATIHIAIESDID